MDSPKVRLTKDEAQAIAAACYENPILFAKTFFPHLFYKKIPWLHRGIIAILTRKTSFLTEFDDEWTPEDLKKVLDNFQYPVRPGDPTSKLIPLFTVGPDNQVLLTVKKFTLLMLPRGFSKTTIAGQLIPLYWILYQEAQFIVYVSESGTHAEMQLANVSRELESNALIHEVFGNLVPDRNDAKVWRQDMIETTTDIAVTCRGRGAQVRGLNHKGRRPDRIIVDDLEDKESVSTPTQLKKVRSWAYGDLLPALPRLKQDSSIVALGTLLHPEALLQQWRKDPQWTSIVFGAVDLQGDPLWPENLNHKDIENLKAQYALAGELSTFYMEYMSQVRNEESAKFKKSFFHYDPTDKPYAARAIAIDPAISDKIGADFCVIAVVEMLDKGKLRVLDVWLKRGASPREQIDTYFELSLKWKCDLHGVEAISYQAALVHLLREEMFRKKHYFEITSITHSTKKTERVEGILQPRYANGYIEHRVQFPELEAQLLDCPNGKKDCPDAVAMAIALLDPVAAQAGMESGDLADAEYPPLEEVFDGDWRSSRV